MHPDWIPPGLVIFRSLQRSSAAALTPDAADGITLLNRRPVSGWTRTERVRHEDRPRDGSEIKPIITVHATPVVIGQPGRSVRPLGPAEK